MILVVLLTNFLTVLLFSRPAAPPPGIFPPPCAEPEAEPYPDGPGVEFAGEGAAGGGAKDIQVWGL